MGSKARNQTSAARTVDKKNQQPRRQTKKTKDRNEHRRELYNSDVGYRERTKANTRKHYRKDNPKKPSQLKDGLLERGTKREVYIFGEEEYYYTTVCYTMPEAAKALGKSYLTLKRWIKEQILPEPILIDCATTNVVYSAGEMKQVAAALKKHEQEFDYLSVHHEVTLNEIWQNIESHRKSSI